MCIHARPRFALNVGVLDQPVFKFRAGHLARPSFYFTPRYSLRQFLARAVQVNFHRAHGPFEQPRRPPRAWRKPAGKPCFEISAAADQMRPGTASDRGTRVSPVPCPLSEAGAASMFQTSPGTPNVSIRGETFLPVP